MRIGSVGCCKAGKRRGWKVERLGQAGKLRGWGRLESWDILHHSPFTVDVYNHSQLAQQDSTATIGGGNGIDLACGDIDELLAVVVVMATSSSTSSAKSRSSAVSVMPCKMNFYI